MAILVYEGWDWAFDRTSPALTNTGFAFSGSAAGIRAGVFGGRAVEMDGGDASWTYTWPGGALGSMSFGIRLFAFVKAVGDTDVIQFRNGTTVLLQLSQNTHGIVRMHRGAALGTIVAETGPGYMRHEAWQYLEVEMVRDAAVGQLRLWLDGVQILDASGLNLGATNPTNIFMTNLHAMDDFYFANTATERQGEGRMQGLLPTADTAAKAWVASTGTNNAAMVDDPSGFNSDTDFVRSATVAALDLYDVADLPAGVATVKSVKTRRVSRKDDATVRSLRTVLKSGATSQNGATAAQITTYDIFDDVYGLDPNTGAAWAPSAVDAAQVGPQVVA
jgi:hypothetical protein